MSQPTEPVSAGDGGEDQVKETMVGKSQIREDKSQEERTSSESTTLLGA